MSSLRIISLVLVCGFLAPSAANAQHERPMAEVRRFVSPIVLTW